MAQIQPAGTNVRKPFQERSTLVCGDCKTGSPLEAFVAVDALHIQCPVCLYVFFRDKARAGTR